MRAVYLNVMESKPAQVVDVEDKLEVFYKLLGCDLITVAERQIGENHYDIIVDDEGLFVENPKVSAANKKGEPQLVGNLLVVKHDGRGNFKGLTDEQAKEVLKAVRYVHAANYDEPYFLLQLNY